MIEFPITFLSDEKGYFDRECPNANCLYSFKVHMDDWKSKFSDDEVHCPMCGHIAPADSWWTQDQLNEMQRRVADYAFKRISDAFDDAFSGLNRVKRKKNGINFAYKPGKRITFTNNPIGQSEEWQIDITCEVCGVRYSVIGSAYFCPCCGHNSAVSVFDESIDTVEKMLQSLPIMKETFTKSFGRDKAETMCRSILEGTLGDIVSAYQKFAECIISQKFGASVKVNDFQIVDKGSKLFYENAGKGYDEWLSAQEIERMNLFFQRRHILEHNNGIVDEKYLQKSGDTTYIEGQHIIVHKEDTHELIGIIKKLSTGLKTLEKT